MTLSTTSFDRAGERRPMATVIPFSHTASRRSRRDEPAAEQARGQILFFTGVRYERMSEGATETAREDAALQRRHS